MSNRPLSLGDQIRARADLETQIGGGFDCFLNTDLDLQITMANEAVGDLLGANPLSLVGISLLDLLDEDSHDDLREYMAKIKKGRKRKRPFVANLTGYTTRGVAGNLYAIRYADQFAVAFTPGAATVRSRKMVVTNSQSSEQLLKLAANLPGASTLEDLGHLLLAFGPRIFPGRIGALYLPSGDRGMLSLACQWPGGSADLSAPEFQQLENMAVRFGRLFLHGLDESGIPCRHVVEGAGRIAFRPTFRDGRLACLIALTIESADDPHLDDLRTFGDLVTDSVVRIRPLKNL